MNLTLHLTESCNMRCSYCTREKRAVRMSPEVVRAACDLAFSSGSHAGLCFFGGEPLLEKELIYAAMDTCASLSEKTGRAVQYKMTTNGTLLDETFLMRVKPVHMGIGLSFEGLAQDTCRRFQDGSGSFSVVEEKARLLLRFLPRSEALMTIAPQAVPQFAASVRYLYDLGFRTILATIAYGKNVQWSDTALSALETQLHEIADFYCECMLAGSPFFFSPIDSKIRDVLKGKNPAERCHLGMRQMPVAPDGRIYACTQFIGDAEYCLGDVFRGLDAAKCAALSRREATPASCRECVLRKRCTNSCGCLNRLETGSETHVSPLQCSYEQMVIALADETADRLYAKAPELFTHRYVS